jgi:hypothetical protein
VLTFAHILYLLAMFATSRGSKSISSGLTLGDIGLTVGDIDLDEEEQDEQQHDAASQHSLAVSV